MHARQTFPVKVLLGRLEQGGAAPWSSFLPDHLRPKEVSAKVFHESASSVKAKAEPKPRRGDYTPVGISVFGRVWEYSQDAAGCREVQLAIEMADEENRLRIVAEFHDHASWLCVESFLHEYPESTSDMTILDIACQHLAQ